MPPLSNDTVTEDDAALPFKEQHAGELIFDHNAGTGFHWSGTRWQREKTGLAFDWARSLARKLARIRAR